MAQRSKSNPKAGVAQQDEEDHQSDIDDLDFDNFKGIYFGDKVEKYQDPVSGCHFEYFDLCRRLSYLKQKRKVLDKRLGLKTTSMQGSPQTAKDGDKTANTNSHSKAPQTDIEKARQKGIVKEGIAQLSGHSAQKSKAKIQVKQNTYQDGSQQVPQPNAESSDTQLTNAELLKLGNIAGAQAQQAQVRNNRNHTRNNNMAALKPGDQANHNSLEPVLRQNADGSTAGASTTNYLEKRLLLQQ